MRTVLTIATRGSKLALWQANHIRDAILAQHPGTTVELLILKTQGDKILDVPLAKIGGKGLFVKEIEEALLDGRADLAVHSMKDVPTVLPDGLHIAITPEREAPTDTLLTTRYPSLDALPHSAHVGTSSLRRQSQLLLMRPDLNIQFLRGNLDTRLGKLMDNQFDAIVLATSGLKRLGATAPFMIELGPPRFLPAVAQGALGIETRTDDDELHEMLAFLQHETSRITVQAERGFLTGLDGGCQVPIAAHAVLDGDTVTLTGLVAEPDGSAFVRDHTAGPATQAFELGMALAERVLAAGAKEILDKVYGNDE